MYCPSCGAEYALELKYCNRCGANLSSALQEPPQTVSVNLTKPALIIGLLMAIVTIAGFLMVIAAALDLSRNPRFGPDALASVIVPGMLTILTIDILLARQLSKIITATLSSAGLAQPKKTKAIANPPMVQFPQPPTSRLEGVPSVTEGTTRFFEKARTSSPSDPETADKAGQ
jgi:hypothetical protein